MPKTRTVVFACLSLLALASMNLQRIPGLLGKRAHEAGMQHLNAGRHRQAAAAFREASFFVPGQARPYIDLGDALLRLEKYDEAGVAFRRALSLQEDSCAYCGLGAAYYRTGRYDEAERAFRRASELSPNDECAYDWSGSMFYELGRYGEAA
ncbi:MAG TPA: tetratricopeptide repeat protein, partial [Pyrinomonadaceae bacterium]